MTNPTNNDVRIAIGYDLDEASVSSAERALSGTDKTIADIGKEAKKGSREIGLFARAQANAAKSGKQAAASSHDVADALREEAKAAQQAANELEERNRKLQEAQSERFDQTSRDVALAGDVESNLRTVGGTLGAFGGAGAEGAIGKGAEIFAVVEALPRLKEAAAGLPQTFGAAATAMGTSKAALGGFIGGLAALGIAMQLATAQAERQRAAAQGQLDAQREVLDFVSTATSEQVEAELEAARRRREAQVEADRFAQKQLEYARQQLSENFGEIGGIGVEAAAALKLGAGEIEALRLNAAAAGDTLDATNIEIATLENALASGATAANDAAQAERDLAAERTQGILDAAQQEGELIRARQEAAKMTREENQQRAKQLADEQERLRGELAVLQNSGDTSEDVARRIEALTQQIANLGQQADVFKNATGKAAEGVASAASNIEKSAAKAAQSEASASSRFERRRADSARSQTSSFSFADALGIGARQSDDKTGADAENKAEKLADINQQFLDDLHDASVDFHREEQQASRQAQDEQRRIRREGRRAEQEATRERNFAAAADAREAAQEQLDDLAEDQRIEQREREIALREQRADIRLNQERQLRDLHNANNQKRQMELNFQQGSLNGWAQYYNHLSQLQRRVTGGAGRQPAQPQQNTNSLFNQLSYIQG